MVGLISTVISASAETLLKEIDFTDTDSYATSSGYDQTRISNDEFWEYFAFNSNNADWQEIRCGRKGVVSKPYIKTLKVLDVDVDYIEVTFSSLYKEDLLTVALFQSSTTPDFKSVNAEQNIKGKIVTNETVRFNLTKPGINLYYRLYFETAADGTTKKGDNGKILSIKKVALFSDENIKDLPDLAFPETEYNVVLGDLFVTPTLDNPDGVEVVYTSSNEDVATVDPATGVITEIKKRGNTTITATSVETADFGVSVAEYELYVTLPLSGIHYHETVLTVDKDSENVFPELINPNNLPVVYASSNTKVATIDATTGEITIIGTGTTRISAKYTEDNEDVRVYEDSEVDYMLTVIDSSIAYTFDFVKNTYGYNRESGSSSSYLPDHASFTSGSVTITYNMGADNNAKARFWSDGLRIQKANSNTEGGVILSIQSPAGYYISSVETQLGSTMDMGFYVKGEGSHTSGTSHSWVNSKDDPNITSIDYKSYTTTTKAIESITVTLKPFAVNLTAGGYFTEPVQVIVSGNSSDKNVTVYYANKDVEELGNVSSVTIDRNATVTVTSKNLTIAETYVFSRDITSLSKINVIYDENVGAFVASGEVYFEDDTEDLTDKYHDIYPDAYHLYINGVDMGEVVDDPIPVSNITPDAKFEVAVVKHDMNFVATNIFQVVDITDEVEWDFSKFEISSMEELKNLELGLMDNHIVNHDKDTKKVHSELRLSLNGGNANVLKNMPLEFVVAETSHEQGYFVLHNASEKEGEDNYEIRYVVDHAGEHADRDAFFASDDKDVKVKAALGFRFVVNEPAEGPQTVRRRAEGDTPKVPTQVYTVGEPTEFAATLSDANSGMSGVEDVAVEAGEAVEFFNIQGVRLNAEPQSGLYIRRQGGNVAKVVR